MRKYLIWFTPLNGLDDASAIVNGVSDFGAGEINWTNDTYNSNDTDLQKMTKNNKII